MRGMFFLGIDIGTYETKGVLMDEACRIIETHTEKHGLENPKPGHFEHDAENVWWHDLCMTSRALLQKTGIDGTQVAAVAASALGADLVPVDRHCRPLRKAILYGIDARADHEISLLNDLFGLDRVLAFNGHPLCSSDIPPKILWLKNNESDVYENAFKFLTGSSYIVAKLTGSHVIDRFQASCSFAPLYEAQTGRIQTEYCGVFCREDQLPTMVETTHIAGRITQEAAAETGLAAGTPVISGTDDSAAEAVSIGMLKPGDLMVQLGSTMFLIGITQQPVQDPRIWSAGFVIPGTNSVQGGTNTAGALTRWYRDNLFPDAVALELAGGINAYESMMVSLEDIPPGSDGLVTLPYLAGERTPLNDPHAKGMVFGLHLKHTRQHLYRSALESIGYSLMQHLRIFKENQQPARNICAVGGGTKNPLWIQIIADITGQPITVPAVGIGASYGDALMAAIGIGHLKDFAAISEYLSPGTVYTPDGTNHAVYQHYQQIFDELYECTKLVMHRI